MFFVNKSYEVFQYRNCHQRKTTHVTLPSIVVLCTQARIRLGVVHMHCAKVRK